MKIRNLYTFFTIIFIFCGCSIPENYVGSRTKKAFPEIVNLTMTDVTGKPISYGWGFFVSPIYIVTNLHVVAWTSAGFTSNGTSDQNPIKGIVAIDQENDLVLLKSGIPCFESVRFGDSNKLQQDDRVYMVDCHLWGGQVRNVSYKAANIGAINKHKNKKRFLINNEISSFSCGLPVLNSRRKVIGVTSTELGDLQYMQYRPIVIPSEYVKALIRAKGPVMPLAESKDYVSAETYFKRGNTKFIRKLFAEAILDYDKVIRFNSKYGQAYFNRGLSKRNLGKKAEAKQDFETALKLAAQTGDVYFLTKIEDALHQMK
ncbi:hypothetical protein F4X73_13180 [Candidatus Poribacteria bacterium]|nr:hypothetical protein [Candidatus Poribacteria bacterium]